MELARPQSNTAPKHPACVVGVDAGVRRLATVANGSGRILERVENPRALDRSLARLRALHGARSRCTPGSVRYRRRTEAISILNARIANQRSDAMHKLTTHLAKTHGTVVVESLSVSSMLTQKGLFGARRRRRDLSDASMAGLRRHLSYKCGWYGSVLVEADPLYPSSRLCHVCGERNTPGWSATWTCVVCCNRHDRDDNAAINLARYSEGDVGAVGAPDKRGAERARPGLSGLLAVKRRRCVTGLPGKRTPERVNPVRGTGTGG